MKEEDWFYALATDQTALLQLILEYRWISPPETPTGSGSVFQRDGKVSFQLQELRELLCVALEHVHFAPCWLPVLLKAGLQPSLLLHPHMFDHADSDALNYLLEFVNWTTLPGGLKIILERRREEQTWKPWPHFDTITSLSHMCRLQIRSMLGPDLLMRTSIVQQLPVPSPLHCFLQFRDIQEPSYKHSPLSNQIQRHNNTHQHRHVL
ncbi:unnamed protein product [Tetraodon nigroviridis]|nr:unnamed protein product [Tetraodon nigroviridis]